MCEAPGERRAIMNARHPFFLMFLAAGCLLAAGCDDSKNPLSDPGQSKPDPRLAGVWRCKPGASGGDVMYYHVAPAGGKLPASIMWVVLNDSATQPKQDQLGTWPDVMVGFPTVLGKTTYLNLGGSTAPNAMDKLEAERLEGRGHGELFHLQIPRRRRHGPALGDGRGRKKQAIQSGKIKGVIEKSSDGEESIRLTDTTENQARFVAAAGDGLFKKEPVRLERVK